jgi:hypothetical protein
LCATVESPDKTPVKAGQPEHSPKKGAKMTPSPTALEVVIALKQKVPDRLINHDLQRRFHEVTNWLARHTCFLSTIQRRIVDLTEGTVDSVESTLYFIIQSLGIPIHS